MILYGINDNFAESEIVDAFRSLMSDESIVFVLLGIILLAIFYHCTSNCLVNVVTGYSHIFCIYEQTAYLKQIL